ncbi:MAG: hypothetical protein ACPGZT_06025 [Luminiphilus sp.]
MPVALNFSQRADATKPASERAFFWVSFADLIDYWCLQALAALRLSGLDTRNSMRSFPQIPTYPADTAFHRFPAEKVAVAE